MNFEDDMDQVQGEPLPNGFQEEEVGDKDCEEDRDWEAWKDVTGTTYRGVVHKKTMLEYYVDSAKGTAQHAVTCNDPKCLNVRRPVGLCDLATFLLSLTLDAKRFKDTKHEREVDAVLRYWSSLTLGRLIQDPRYILFSSTYNIILVQAAVKRDSTFAPAFGGNEEGV